VVPFSHYVGWLSEIVCIHFCPNDWHQSTCSCIYFKKSYICSHLLGLAIRLKLVEAPAEAQNLPLGKIRGSGRPSKVPINSCYTGEFVASQFAKIKPSQVTQTVVVVDQQESDEDKDEDAEDAVNSPVKPKRRGRPLGSKNKKRI
jgi:hypothetical protein